MSDKNGKIQQQLLEAGAAPLIIEETENVSVEMDEVKTEGTTVKTTIDEGNDNSDKKKNSKKKKNNEDIEKKCIDSKYNYIVLSKGQVYSFLRNGFISSGVECGNSDPIKKEKYISNNILYVFNENNLPKLQGDMNSQGNYDVLLRVEFDNDNPYLIKNSLGKIIGLKGFAPITSSKEILFLSEKEMEDFKNPVPNKNNNFVIPSNLCSVNKELYGQGTNELEFIESDLNVDDVINKIDRYNRLLGAFFFANYGAYTENNLDNYSEKYIKFLFEYYKELPNKFESQNDKTNNLMLKLAYSGEFSKIESVNDLYSMLLDNHIINITDHNYLKSMYTSTSGFADFGALFTHRKDSEDDITWQIISFLLQYSCNKSGEEKSLALSNSVRGKFANNINILSLFILGLCCGYSDAVCEMEGDETFLIQNGKMKFKDIFSPIRSKIAKEVFDYVVLGKGFNPFEYGDSSKDVELDNDYVITKTELTIIGEKCVFTKKSGYSDYYLTMIKNTYGENFEKIDEKKYISNLLMKKSNLGNIEDKQQCISSLLKDLSQRNEEIEQVVALDKQFNIL